MAYDDVYRASIVLSNQSDWNEWIASIQMLSVTNGVWKYINPNSKEPLPAAPTRPNIPNFTRTESDIDKQIKWEEYKRDMEDYKAYNAGINAIQKTIMQSIDRKNLVHLIDVIEVRDQLKTLKQNFAMSSQQNSAMLAERYRYLCQPPRSGNTNAEDWARKWESTYNECVKANMPDVQDDRHKNDFIQSTRHLTPEFYSTWNNEYIKYLTRGDSNKLPDLKELLSIFMLYDRQIKSNKSSLSEASMSFGTLQGQSDGNSPNPPKYQEHKTDTRSIKCICGLPHKFGFYHCPYANPEIRDNNWKEDPEARKRINSLLQRNPRAKQFYDKVQKEKNVNSKQDDSDSDNESINEAIHSHYTGIRYACVAIANNISTNSMSDDNMRQSFVYDTGTDGHICNDKSMFISLRKTTTIVKIGDTTAEGSGIGEVILYPTKPLCETAKKGILLKNVLYAPNFHTSLFSADKGEKGGIYYNSRSQILEDKSGNPICRIKRDGLYCLTWPKHASFSAETRRLFEVESKPNVISSNYLQAIPHQSSNSAPNIKAIPNQQIDGQEDLDSGIQESSNSKFEATDQILTSPRSETDTEASQQAEIGRDIAIPGEAAKNDKNSNINSEAGEATKISKIGASKAANRSRVRTHSSPSNEIDKISAIYKSPPKPPLSMISTDFNATSKDRDNPTTNASNDPQISLKELPQIPLQAPTRPRQIAPRHVNLRLSQDHTIERSHNNRK